MNKRVLKIIAGIVLAACLVLAAFMITRQFDLPVENVPEGADPQENGFSSSETPAHFGVHPSSLENYAYARDLGLNFNREGVYFIWDWSDNNKDGQFSFKHALLPPHPEKPNSGGVFNYDQERERIATFDEITLISNVCPFRGGSTGKDEFTNSDEQENYRLYVEKLVERYDGDEDLGCTELAPDCYRPGDQEYPAQSVITALANNPIKFWQVCNQVTDVCSGKECSIDNEYAEKFADVQRLTYLGVKAACPECQVAIGGDSGADMYPPVYEELNGEYIDIIDIHIFGDESAYLKTPETLEYLRDHLRKSGFDLNELGFWITETGTYSGDPDDMNRTPMPDLPYQSESQQAQGLVKLFVTAFGEDVEKVFWAWGLKEGFNQECSIFDYTGLIYDGNRTTHTCFEDDDFDQGADVKKLAYYSLELLIEKIGMFTEVEKLQDTENFVYEFTREDQTTVYVAWNDQGGTLTLTDVEFDRAIITQAVPGFDLGGQVNDVESAFETEIKSINEGLLSIDLSKTPVFFEEY